MADTTGPVLISKRPLSYDSLFLIVSSPGNQERRISRLSERSLGSISSRVPQMHSDDQLSFVDNLLLCGVNWNDPVLRTPVIRAINIHLDGLSLFLHYLGVDSPLWNRNRTPTAALDCYRLTAILGIDNPLREIIQSQALEALARYQIRWLLAPANAVRLFVSLAVQWEWFADGEPAKRAIVTFAAARWAIFRDALYGISADDRIRVLESCQSLFSCILMSYSLMLAEDL